MRRAYSLRRTSLSAATLTKRRPAGEVVSAPARMRRPAARDFRPPWVTRLRNITLSRWVAAPPPEGTEAPLGFAVGGKDARDGRPDRHDRSPRRRAAQERVRRGDDADRLRRYLRLRGHGGDLRLLRRPQGARGVRPVRQSDRPCSGAQDRRARSGRGLRALRERDGGGYDGHAGIAEERRPRGDDERLLPAHAA